MLRHMLVHQVRPEHRLHQGRLCRRRLPLMCVPERRRAARSLTTAVVTEMVRVPTPLPGLQYSGSVPFETHGPRPRQDRLRVRVLAELCSLFWAHPCHRWCSSTLRLPHTCVQTKIGTCHCLSAMLSSACHVSDALVDHSNAQTQVPCSSAPAAAGTRLSLRHTHVVITFGPDPQPSFLRLCPVGYHCLVSVWVHLCSHGGSGSIIV